MVITHQAPEPITPAQAATWAREHYGLSVAVVEPLAGEIDHNFYLRTATGQEYTLKVSRPAATAAEIEFQTAILTHLSSKTLSVAIPRVVPTRAGTAQIPVSDPSGQSCFLRLQTWIPGCVLAQVTPRTEGLFHSWGQTSGELVAALADFDHPAAHRFYKWDPSQLPYTRAFAADFRDAEELAVAHHFWSLFDAVVAPALPHLRQGVNYNDAHEHNLLVSPDYEQPTVVGVIDFGDALHTHTINELAIAIAYAAMDLPDPLAAAAAVVRGFHSVYPLQEEEVAVLFPLVAARLLLSVAQAARNQRLEPDNTYLQISARPAWALLHQLRTVAPAFAHQYFRWACGWEPAPQRKAYEVWRQQHGAALHPVVDVAGTRVTPLDLSVGSLDLGNNSNFIDIQPFTRTIDQLLAEAEAGFGVGGYGECRPVYTTDAYLQTGNQGPRWRTCHLGLDVWGPAYTPVRAPLAGVVHSFQNNTADRDYGPAIILEHRQDNCTFYTLYGHLSAESLEGLQVGQTIGRGQAFAAFGAPPVNGNWPPHLHFQVILDLYGQAGDFPGVAFPEEAPLWLSNCPDPYPFAGAVPLPAAPGPTAAEILALRHQYLGASLSISYAQPLHLVRGYGQYLYDVSGRRYLDTVNNVAHVGHEHPRVVRAGQRQLGLLNTNTRYLHANLVQYARELAATLPDPLSVVFLVNSGSEANELAIRMARTYTGQRDLLALEVGYHGNTNACIAVSSYKFDGKGGQGAPADTHIVPLPDTYRGRYRDPQTAGQQYAGHLATHIAAVQAEGRHVAGFIAESIVSCGGQIVLPAGYLAAAYQHVRAAGGLCIADEVQVGFGRVGEAFWGFELQGVVPDIVTLGKPIGNGHPLAAVVTTPAVAAAFANGMEFFNTFGGNPVSCAVGREVLQVIHDENLQQHALRMGTLLVAGLKNLQARFPIIGDVRGHGLFLGFELVTDRQTLAPATRQTAYLANRMRELGFLMSVDGPLHNVIKIKPPLCITPENVDLLLHYLAQVLGEDGMICR